MTVPLVLGAEFSFSAFVSDPVPDARCRRLETVIADRLEARGQVPPPDVLFQIANELRELGHDLWRWDLDGIWGWDSTWRSGRGLKLILRGNEGDDEVPMPRVDVTFSPYRSAVASS